MIKPVKSMYYSYPYSILQCLLVLLCCNIQYVGYGQSQQYTVTDTDILLNFRYPAVGRYYISAVISGDAVYLPVTELFSLLYVHYEKGCTPHSLKGIYLYPENEWYIRPYERKARNGNKHIELTTKDFRVSNMELYLLPEVFKELFGLHFTINMNALNISLYSENILPVEYWQKREQVRHDLKHRQSASLDYPMLYPRKREIIGAGMVDYNLGVIANGSSQVMNYSILYGMGLFGGDLSLSYCGSVNSERFITSNREYVWRYVLDPNKYLTSIRLGTLRTTGILNNRIAGFALSNEPVTPRRLYESVMIDGITTPGSDVELYVNSQLIDHVRTNESGHYRFDYPLHYGTARISKRIYKPTGEIVVEESQVQVPYSFLPAGVWAYNLQGGGYNDQHYAFEKTNRHVLHGSLAYGISTRMTAKAGVEYVSEYTKPIYYTKLSMRLRRKYLLNFDAVSDNYFRISASHNFATRQSIMIRYTGFAKQSSLKNFDIKRELSTGLYWPFQIRELPFGVRLGTEHFVNANDMIAGNYRIDLNFRIRQMNLRFNYRERIMQTDASNKSEHHSIAGVSVNYSLRHKRQLPKLISGFSIRTKIQYSPANNEFSNAGVQLSRSIFRSGRLQIGFDHDFRHKTQIVRGTFSVNLQHFRSSTYVAGQVGLPYVVQQNLTGSVGFDSESSKLIATNRHQVGQGAVSMIMFVDENDNGRYDIGEEIVPALAVRLNHGANIWLGNDSVVRINHLQGYWTYYAEIVQSALKNPGLAPLHKEFAFVADPNVYKRIEVPLYRTGVIDGLVTASTEESVNALGGIRLLLKDVSRDQSRVVRTFSDGGFYAMGLLPGIYKIEIDPVQLAFLNKQSLPPDSTFIIEARADGHFLSNLNFVVIPMETKTPLVAADDKTSGFDHKNADYKLRQHLYLFVKAQNQFNAGLYNCAKTTIDKAINLFETDYSLSLKASLLYLSGEQCEAFNIWNTIKVNNTGILLPDPQLLDRLKK